MKDDTSDPPQFSLEMSDVQFLLSLTSHMPFSEACALKWGHCNPGKGCLLLPSPDGKRPATLLYLQAEQKAWLYKHWEQYCRRYKSLPEKNEFVFLYYDTGKNCQESPCSP